jgi:phytoene synthase
LPDADGILAEIVTELSYAAEQVRRYDHDRFLTTIFAPAAARENLFSLYAFNIEIAKVGEVVSESLIGRMRLQWWRDTLDRLYAGDTVAHAVAAPLGEAIAGCKLAREPFDRLIEAREFDLDRVPPEDMAALERYAGETGAPLIELALDMLGCESPSGREIAGLAGKAWALTGLLRAIPFHARHRRCYLPQDRLDALGLGLTRLFEKKPGDELPVLVQEIAARARFHRIEARNKLAQLPRACRSPLLLLTLGDLYLGDLAKSGWDPFVLEARLPRRMQIANLAFRAALGRY